MPFKSRAQKEYLRINEPEIYERWMRDYDAEDFEMVCRQCKIGNYESCLYGETVDTGGFWLSNCVPDPSMNAETFEAHACDCSNSYRYRFDRDLTAVECDRCGGYLDAHKYKVPSAGVVKYAETFESPVSCKICGKTFDSFRGLNGHMNAHLPSHRKRAEEEELNKYMVSVPVLHHYTVGPVEAYDEEEAAEDVRENWSEWRRTIDNNGDWGGPMWRYLPWYDADPEAYEVFDSETFGDVDSDGQLAQALVRARAKSQEPRRPLKITKLPHRDQTSLKDFEAESNTPLFTKESKVFAIGLASGIVATIFGNLLSEFVIDRYREDPELLDTEQNA
jgi:hypothetical protein